MVELVSVLVVLGILAVGTVGFIEQSTMGYASTIARTQLSGAARITMNRMARELRDALPNSVRVSGDCLEFIPTLGASVYSSAPIGTSAFTFVAAAFNATTTVTTRAAIFPDTAPFATVAPSSLSPTITVSAPDGNNEVVVTMASAHRFPSESPRKRVFLVDEPVSYCVHGGRLWRYTDYGFLTAQPALADLPGSMPQRNLLAQAISSLEPFAVTDSDLVRNAVVRLDMTFAQADESLRLQRLVHLRNVP